MEFAFIDGDHSLQGVSGDWEQVRRILVPEGSVAFDDYDIGTELGENLFGKIVRHVGAIRGIGRISKLHPLLSKLAEDPSNLIQKVVFQGVHQLVEDIYAMGSYNLEVFPYSGTLGIALLSPGRTQSRWRD